MRSTFYLFIFTCFVTAAAAATTVGSASEHMSPATISDELPVNPRNVITEVFPPRADSEGYKSAENPASSATPSAGKVGIPAILPEVNASPESPSHNKLAMIYKAEAGVFFTRRKLMTNAVDPNSPQSPGYLIRDQTAAAPGMAHSSPKLILFIFFLLMIPIYYIL